MKTQEEIRKEIESICDQIDALYEKQYALNHDLKLVARAQKILDVKNKFNVGDRYMIVDHNFTEHYNPIKVYEIVDIEPGNDPDDADTIYSVRVYTVHYYDGDVYTIIEKMKYNYEDFDDKMSAQKMCWDAFNKFIDLVRDPDCDYNEAIREIERLVNQNK